MSNSLEKMRKLLTSKHPELATLASKPRADTSIYRHWEMALNATATLRFLPDGNTNNSQRVGGMPSIKFLQD